MSSVSLPRVRRLAALVAASLLVLSACGITSDDAPRDINAPSANNIPDENQTAITATSTSAVYLVSSAPGVRPLSLHEVARDVAETVSNALGELVAGPTGRETTSGLRTALPDGLRINDVTLTVDIANIDLSAEVGRLTGDSLIAAVAQVVLTATDVTGVSSVVLTVDGQSRSWPNAGGAMQSEPLTRADYQTLLPAGSGPASSAPPST
jgi:spore germination protein GerM